jgi:hypothetical protein
MLIKQTYQCVGYGSKDCQCRAFAQDESETNTEQEIKQKNVGSGESTNNNCDANLIDSAGGGGMVIGPVACPLTSGLLPGR